GERGLVRPEVVSKSWHLGWECVAEEYRGARAENYHGNDRPVVRHLSNPINGIFKTDGAPRSRRAFARVSCKGNHDQPDGQRKIDERVDEKTSGGAQP